jgi:Family of unknown function (DUF5329)
MSKNPGIALCCLLPLLLCFTILCTDQARGESEDRDTRQTIEFLISTIAQSHLTFIRNGQSHTCDEAARHVSEKYDYFRSEINTPEDFISLCASRSLLSGEPYLVVTGKGKVPVKKWLRQILAEHRKPLKDSRCR